MAGFSHRLVDTQESWMLLLSRGQRYKAANAVISAASDACAVDSRSLNWRDALVFIFFNGIGQFRKGKLPFKANFTIIL